jgi:hypothetical protein
MLYPGNQIVRCERDFTEEILRIEGELDDVQAKITLIRFFKQNLGFMLYLLSGVEITAFQEILIKCIFKRDNGLIVAARGGSKSFLIAVLCILYPLLHFNSKMCLISQNFRNARKILEEAEKILCSKQAKLLKACFKGTKQNNIIQRAPDMYRVYLEDPSNSEISALPLSEGLRGTRASFVCVDEGLLIDEDIQTSIIQPFLTARLNAQEEIEIRRRENELIKEGVITENDRISFPKNKYFVFSSASYKFDYLYTFFNKTIENTINPPKPTTKEDIIEEPPTFFVCRFSYKYIEHEKYVDMTQINAAASNNGYLTDYFRREYGAEFVDFSDTNYFNPKKLNACTHKPGSWPTTQIVGTKGSEYILSIDTAYSESRTEDYFAFTVHLLDKEERKITQVNTYGRFGADLKSHFEYFTYLLTHFNIVFIIIDASGTEFIHSYNESLFAKDKKIQLNFNHAEFDTDDASEYAKQLKDFRNNYNLSTKNIVYAQKFSSSNSSIRRMNEYMQGRVNAEKLWFASACLSNERAFNHYSSIQLPYKFKDNNDKELNIGEFIDLQDFWINETKSQISLIEVYAKKGGTLAYDLPISMRNLSGKNKIRRDHYTCNLMANWGAKIYFDMIFNPPEEEVQTFQPILI